MAALKMVCGFINYRFKSGRSMCLDKDVKSFLPNLQRAYLMRTDQSRINRNAVNILWEVVKENFEILHDYTKHSDWLKIRHSNIATLEFPHVDFDYLPNDVYTNLRSRHVFWFS